MKELKKCLDQEITEIKNHQMWNTEVNYIQKQKKIEAEKFADWNDILCNAKSNFH